MPKIFSDEEKNIHKTRLLSEGMKLIAERGLKDVSVNDLAALIYVSKGYFYTLFESKETFFLECIAWRMEQNLEQMQAAKSRGASMDELYEVFYTALFQTQRSYKRLVVFESAKYIYDQVTPEQWERFRKTVEAHFKTLLRLFGKEPATEAARILSNLTNHLFMIYGAYRSRPDLFADVSEESVRILTDSLLAYIRVLP